MKNFFNKIIYIASGLILFAVAGLTVSLVFDKFNLFQIDTVGQLASSQFFRDIGFHQYNIHWFMGMVNNLFYPPAQDFLSSCVVRLSGVNSIVGFRTYTLLLILFYFFSVFLCTKTIKSPILRLGYCCLFVGYFLIEKQNLTFLQGGGLVDIFFTGLNSQILGLSFLNLLIAEFLGKNRNLIIFIFAVFGFLSHIVVIPIIGLVLLYRFLFDISLKNLLLGIGVLLATSFFWIPFFESRFLLTSATIIFPTPFLLTGIVLICLFVSYWVNNKLTLLLSLVGFTLLLPTDIYHLAGKLGFSVSLPAFHYYRFASPIYAMTLFLFFKLIDSLIHRLSYRTIKYLYILPIISTLFLGLVFMKDYNLTNWNRLATRVDRYDLSKSDLKALDQVGSTQRIFVLDNKRAVDFNLDSLLQVYRPDLLFVKGLYWESHFSNELLTSYLANLLNPRDMIVNYFKFGSLSCNQTSDLRSRFVSRYGVGWMLINHLGENKILSDESKKCFNDMLLNGTDQFLFEKRGVIKINNLTYFVVKVSPRSTGELNNQLVASISEFSLTYIDAERDSFAFRQVFLDDVESVTGSFVYPISTTSDYSGFILDQSVSTSGIVSNISTNNHRLTRTVDGTESSLTHVKFNRYPGVGIVSPTGKPYPIVPVIDGIIVRGAGDMTLVYNTGSKSNYLLLLSLVGFVGFALYFLVFDKEKNHLNSEI